MILMSRNVISTIGYFGNLERLDEILTIKVDDF